jgi:hypothetical protein
MLPVEEIAWAKRPSLAKESDGLRLCLRGIRLRAGLGPGNVDTELASAFGDESGSG